MNAFIAQNTGLRISGKGMGIKCSNLSAEIIIPKLYAPADVGDEMTWLAITGV